MIPIYGVERHNNDCFAVPPYFHLFILAQDDDGFLLGFSEKSPIQDAPWA